ncbi:MAG: hypothetical protein H6728_12750 [Myxococcales bacterium]|nr:hypothetical protein [Myxococcales bacterium]
MRWMKVFGWALVGVLCLQPQQAKASKIQKAIDAYLKGQSYSRAKKYPQALKSFETAYRFVPRLPRFNCRRSTFLQYQGQMLYKMRRPYAAMQRYYKAAYKSGCEKAATTKAAMSWYRTLDRRYMCYLTISSTPPKAKIVQITTQGENKIGDTPWKKRLLPGRYRYKIRLYEHKTVFLDFQLRPGQRINKEVTLVKGDDPLSRNETLSVAPPPPLGDAPGSDPNAGSSEPANTVPGMAPPKRRVKIAFEEDPAEKRERAKVASSGGIGTKDDDLGITRRKVVKDGPPIYKQAWFWITIGAVVTGAVVVAVVVPKPQNVNVGQGSLF